jgi:hypothetical protein
MFKMKYRFIVLLLVEIAMTVQAIVWHFTWTTYNGGTCWMKKGTVSKD